MALPINVKATNIELTPELTRLTEDKLAPVERFVPSGSQVKVCEVELEKRSEHQTGKVFRAEVNIEIDGKLFRAEETDESFENALDSVQSSLKREIRKDKERGKTLIKRGGARIKDMLRFGRN